MKYVKIILILISMGLFSACSSINLRNTQDLAISGSNASMRIAELYSKRVENLELYLEGEYILAGLKDGYSVPGEKTITKVDCLKNEMLARKRLFAEFAEVYNSFAELAVYEESEKIQTSVKGLTSAINDYSEITTGKVRFTEADEDLAAFAGAELFEAYHKAKIKKASKIIRKRLEILKKLIEKQSEKSAVIAMEKEIDRNRLKVAFALWSQKLGLPTEIISRHIQTYGLQVNKKETMRQIDRATSGKMQKAIENVMRFRHNRKIRTRKDAYEASINAIQVLITAHMMLEKGEPLSVDSLHSFLKKVNAYAALNSQR